LNPTRVHRHAEVDSKGALLPWTSWLYADKEKKLRKFWYESTPRSAYNDWYTPDTVYIFTEFDTGNDIDHSFMGQCRSIARVRGCPFVPVILRCSKRENIKRLCTAERKKEGRLTDKEFLKKIMEKGEQVYPWLEEMFRMEMDVTNKNPDEAARGIFEHVFVICENMLNQKLDGDEDSDDSGYCSGNDDPEDGEESSHVHGHVEQVNVISWDDSHDYYGDLGILEILHVGNTSWGMPIDV
jgi:hypothetical protein